jgi:hypothetical protein
VSAATKVRMTREKRILKLLSILRLGNVRVLS